MACDMAIVSRQSLSAQVADCSSVPVKKSLTFLLVLFSFFVAVTDRPCLSQTARSASRKRARDDNLRIRSQTSYRDVVMADQKPRLIQPMRRELMAVAYVDLVFLKCAIRTSAGEHRTSNTLILYRSALVRVADPELIAVGKIVKNSP